jgi:hypothetical protein
MTYCEMLEWFFGKSRFATDARPERCAECPAHAAAHAAEWCRRHVDWGDGAGDGK